MCTIGICGIKEVSGSEMAVPQAKLMIFDSTSLQFKQGTGIAEAASLLTIVRLSKILHVLLCHRTGFRKVGVWAVFKSSSILRQLLTRVNMTTPASDEKWCCLSEPRLCLWLRLHRGNRQTYAVKNSDRENGVAACIGWGAHCRVGRSLNNLDCATNKNLNLGHEPHHTWLAHINWTEQCLSWSQVFNHTVEVCYSIPTLSWLRSTDQNVCYKLLLRRKA